MYLVNALFVFSSFLFIQCAVGEIRKNSGDGEMLISFGTRALIQDYPWHVGIYRFTGGENYTLDCGGSLITIKHVVTAAHCFWEERAHRLMDKDLYKIALGKFHRDWTIKDPGMIYVGVDKIVIQSQYRGRSGNFQYDIAIVQLETTVELSSYIDVVYIDWSNEYHDVQMTEGTNGTVVGWGFTEGGKQSEILRYTQLPYVSTDNCSNLLDSKLRYLVTSDKFCAGYIGRNVSVCRGDSGGGLVFYNEANSKHYLRGVVSINFKPAANTDLCYAQHVTGFTMVSDPIALRWLKQNTKLELGCGKRKESQDPHLIAGGLPLQSGEFPWHAGLYHLVNRNKSKYEQICGGTLITVNLVVTAAHCFHKSKWNDTYKNDHKIVLGKYYQSWRVKEKYAQTIDIAEVIKHPNFTWPDTSNDIAVVVLASPARLTDYVNVICVDWDNLYDDKQLAPGCIGDFVGWGFYEDEDNEDPSETLKRDELYIVSQDDCFKAKSAFPSRRDKFCVRSLQNGQTNICTRDSGGGLTKSNSSASFLRGIASVCATDGNTYSEYTRLSAHLEWLRQVSRA